MQPESTDREIFLPSGALAALARSLEQSGGPAAALLAFREAGDAAADPLADGLRPAEVESEAHYWRRLGAFLGQRGWGSFRHESPHPGVGLLRGRGWAAGPDGGAFTEALLSRVLTEAAGDPVRVLRVTGPNDEASFAFGSPTTLSVLEQRLAEGLDLDEALAAL